MFKKYLVLMVTALIINLTLSGAVFADTKAEKAAKHAEKIRTSITKLGSGESARVEVKLKNGSKVKGYISQIGESSFVVADEKTGALTEVPYPQTKQVRGNNLSTGVKIAIGVGIAIAIILIIGFLAPAR